MPQPAIRSYVGRFFGLSRMSHSVLDVPYLAVGAVLALGGVPPVRTIALGLVSAFAGLTAIFALNDIIDRRVDALKMSSAPGNAASFDLDSLGFRHPVAQGKLSFGAGVAWTAFWSVLAFATAWLVRPACAWLLVAAAALEGAYCSLLRITPWKTVLSGFNVAVGGLAGLYAVTSFPSRGLTLLYFLWAFAWEVGCRNIPNDWTDFSEDVALGIKTIPVRFGLLRASRISFALMGTTVLCAGLFPLLSPLAAWPVYEVGAIAASTYLLLLPSLRWQRDQSRKSALAFFNRACFFPLAIFAALGAAVAIRAAPAPVSASLLISSGGLAYSNPYGSHTVRLVGKSGVGDGGEQGPRPILRQGARASRR